MIGVSDFPPFVPEAFRLKCDSATLIVSGSGSNTAVLVYNFRRLDGSVVDEHPYGYLVISGSEAVSGSFLEHGNWDGRATDVSDGFKAHVSASGIGNYFLAHPPGGILSGSLDQLSDSDTKAFETFKRAIGLEK